MGLTYQWQVSTDSTATVFADLQDGPLVSGTKTPTLTFNNLTVADNSKKYRVVVGSEDFNVAPIVSDAATLFTAPSITLSTIPDIATTATTATFSVTGVANTGTISYQWQKRVPCAPTAAEPCFINLIDQVGAVSGSISPNLVLSGLTASVHNNSQYRVVASAQCCGTTAITQSSNTATLQVATQGQTLFITKDLTDATIATNKSASLSIEIQTTTTNSTQVPVTFTWQKLVGGNWTGITNTQPIENTVLSPTLILYKQTLQITGAVDGESYRVVVGDGRSSSTSSSAKTKNPATCTGCGGSGTGDPHFYIGGSYGFDDNPIINGHKEIVMLYLKNKKDNTEHILTCKNTGTFGKSSPYNVERTSYIQKKDGQLVGARINDAKADMMGVVMMNASAGRFGFTWSILDPANINKAQDLDIIIGGAWYWMCKSLIQYLKKNPAFMSLGWPYIGWIHADGIGLGLAPYELVRENFEIDNLYLNNSGSANIDGLYIASSKDDPNTTRYNKDNSAYSIMRDRGVWQIKTRVLAPISMSKISDTKFTISVSNYADAESLSVGLGVGSSVAGVVSGNPVISAISYKYPTQARAMETATSISAEITVTGGTILTNGSVNFGYFVNTTSGSNGVTLPSIFGASDIYIGQKIIITGATAANTTISVINGSAITLGSNCTATGRFPLEIIYAESFEDNASSPDLSSGWLKNKNIIPNIKLLPLLSSAEGLSKISEDISNNPRFWNELSLALSGKPLDGTPVNSIVSQPKDVASINGTASFSVVAEFANSRYQWQKSTNNGVSWTDIAGATNSTLVINAIRSDNGTLFRAKVDNLLTSNSAKLSVPSTLKIQQEPANVSAVNLQAIFGVVASGVQPITYQWQKSDDNGINFSNIANNNLPTLSLSNLKAEDDNDLYKVSVADGAGDSYSSAAYKLSVNPVVSVVSQPTNQTASEEETASFSVSGVCDNGPFKYQWEVSTNNGVSYAVVQEPSYSGNLNLSGLKIYDNNKLYRARLVSDIKNNFVYSSGARLFVPNSLTIVNNPANTISSSGNATFSVAANSSQPPLSYQWQRQSPQSTSWLDIVSGTGSTLNVSGLKLVDDNTKYRVVLTDQRGSVYSNEAIVDTTPHLSITQNISGYTSNNYKLSLTLVASVLATTLENSSTNLAYSWEKANPGSSLFAPITGIPSNQNYLLGDLKVADSGVRYRAKLTLPGARDVYSNIAQIDVPESISVNIKSQLIAKTNYPNTDITLSVDATTKVPPLSYQWQKASTSNAQISYQFPNNDPFYDRVGLLMEMSGVSGTRAFVDSSDKTYIIPYRDETVYNQSADIKLSSLDFKSPPTSARFNDIYSHLRVVDSGNVLSFGNKSFTIEYWYKPTIYSEMSVVSRRKGNVWPVYGNVGWTLSSTRFRAKIGEVWRDDWIDDNVSLPNIPINEWSHVALTRYNNTYRLFRNGSLVGSFFNSSPLDETSGPLVIGTSSSVHINGTEHSYSLVGFLDNLRITVGLARYTQNFTPDTLIDSEYQATITGSNFTDIPSATGNILKLEGLTSNNNLERYRVVLTDPVSTVIVEN
jgi:hypothetical protein